MSGYPDRSHERSSANDKRISQESNILLYSIIVSVIAFIAFIAIIVYNNLEKPSCNLESAINRNFYVYYGINNSNNPFSDLSAENKKSSLFYEPVISDDMKLSSVIITASRGSGKTRIREYKISKLANEGHAIIKFYGNDMNRFLGNFIMNVKDDRLAGYEKIAKYWTENDFVHMILHELTSFIKLNFPDSYYVKKLPFEDRLNMAMLLCFYSRDMTQELTRIVNLLLHDKKECYFGNCDISVEKIDPHVKSSLTNKYVNKQEFTEIEKLHSNVRISSNEEAYLSLVLLYGIAMHVKHPAAILLQKAPIQHVSILTNFLVNMMHTKPVIILDSLDESPYFFNYSDAHLESLQKFLDSATNQEVLGLALGEKNKVPFDIVMFIPEICGLKIKWSRNDKIPIISLKWEPKMLTNYADFVFDYLRQQQKRHCQILPLFSTFVNGTENVDYIMSHIRHPRDLHIFFTALIPIMNAEAHTRASPFIATREDIEKTVNELKKKMLNEKNC